MKIKRTRLTDMSSWNMQCNTSMYWYSSQQLTTVVSSRFCCFCHSAAGRLWLRHPGPLSLHHERCEVTPSERTLLSCINTADGRKINWWIQLLASRVLKTHFDFYSDLSLAGNCFCKSQQNYILLKIWTLSWKTLDLIWGIMTLYSGWLKTESLFSFSPQTFQNCIVFGTDRINASINITWFLFFLVLF